MASVSRRVNGVTVRARLAAYTGAMVQPAWSERGESGAARGQVLRALVEALGPDRVLADEASLRRLAGDMFGRWRGGQTPPPLPPLVVVRPRSTEEVAAAVRRAAVLQVPLVAFGGGTGLMGGARTIAPGIALDLRALNHIGPIAREDRIAHVGAGVVLGDLARAVAPYGLIVGHDPWTFFIATVGGAFSTNGLGYLAGKYGSMAEQVLGVTVVLADGTVARTRPAERSSTGPRLKELFAGAEGTLGIVTELDVRLWPAPEAEIVRGYRFPGGFDQGFRAIAALVSAGIRPATIDFGQARRWQQPADVPVAPQDEEGILHLVFHGLREETRALARRAEQILRVHGALPRSARAARRFWEERHVDPVRIRARQEAQGTADDWPPPDLLVDFLHVWLPTSRVLEVKRAAQELLFARGVSVGEWGLWHGPELFSIAVFTRGRTPDDAARLGDACDAVLRLVQDAGGSMEYVHGVGLRLAHLMAREHGAGLEILRAIKRALDPAGLLNPGKLGL